MEVIKHLTTQNIEWFRAGGGGTDYTQHGNAQNLDHKKHVMCRGAVTANTAGAPRHYSGGGVVCLQNTWKC